VSLRTILLSDEDDIIENLMETHVISVGTLEDKEDVAQTFSKYDFIALPVVDKEDRLVGIITVDDAMDVMEAEATEDIEKMAAMLPTDKPYLKTSVFETFKSRIPWLLLLMVSATFTGQIIAKFEDALGACAILTAYIPMLTDTGGNAGSQSTSTIIRGMAVGELRPHDLPRILWRECRVALLCGLTLALCNFVKLLVLDRVGLMVAAVVCLTLVVTVVLSQLLGAALPALAEKIGIDPAVMASPLITTIVDTTTLLVYFNIARVLLHL
ncbi:magnesium transporter, partial [bacterium]|nr:magnesium transporter [bacterium]